MLVNRKHVQGVLTTQLAVSAPTMATAVVGSPARTVKLDASTMARPSENTTAVLVASAIAALVASTMAQMLAGVIALDLIVLCAMVLIPWRYNSALACVLTLRTALAVHDGTIWAVWLAMAACMLGIVCANVGS